MASFKLVKITKNPLKNFVNESQTAELIKFKFDKRTLFRDGALPACGHFAGSKIVEQKLTVD